MICNTHGFEKQGFIGAQLDQVNQIYVYFWGEERLLDKRFKNYIERQRAKNQE